jgi:hypothetical protein
MSAVRQAAADYASITQRVAFGRVAFGRIVVPVRMAGTGWVSERIGIPQVRVNRVRFA